MKKDGEKINISKAAVESKAKPYAWKTVKRRRTKAEMVALKNSKQSIAHCQRWYRSLSDEKKKIVLKT